MDPTEQPQDMDQARQLMVDCQIRTWDVLDPRVLEVLSTMPRERFVPERYRALAFCEASIPLAQNQIMLPPKLDGRILQAAAVQPGETVLDVGTGSGYLAACLAELGGQVLSVDYHEQFCHQASETWKDLGLANLEARQQDASRLDWTDESYDVITVTGAMPQLHDSFRERLKLGGRLIAILGRSPAMEAVLYTRMDEDDWARDSLFETDVPTLVNAWDPVSFTL